MADQSKRNPGEYTIMQAQGVNDDNLENRRGYRLVLPCSGKKVKKNREARTARRRA